MLPHIHQERLPQWRWQHSGAFASWAIWFECTLQNLTFEFLAIICIAAFHPGLQLSTNFPFFPLHCEFRRSAQRTRITANIWQLRQTAIFQDANSPAADDDDDVT